MIIYTGLEDCFMCNTGEIEEVEIDLGGSSRLVVRPRGFNRATVQRLISSDPQDYLRQEFQPGAEIELPVNFSRN